MMKTKYALAYSKSNNHELQSFIRSRGLDIQLRTQEHRKPAIRQLRKADLDMQFRFLDLSPEMIHEEAEGILLHENTIRIIFYLRSERQEATNIQEDVGVLRINGHSLPLKTVELNRLPSRWPRLVLRTSRISVVCNLKSSRWGGRRTKVGTAPAINSALHHLFYSLRADPGIRRVNISVVMGQWMRPDRFENFLYPLKLLGTGAQLDLKGVPADITERIKSETNKFPALQSLDIYAKYASLRDEATAFASFTTKVALAGRAHWLKVSWDSFHLYFDQLKTAELDRRIGEMLEGIESVLNEQDAKVLTQSLHAANLPDATHVEAADDLRTFQRLREARAVTLGARIEGAVGVGKGAVAVLSKFVPHFLKLSLQ
ncbi:hypothetical protein LTR37_016502 [Vermiconidia calcicola]|uniref:Uncharacterized protein n=1 Tax=Vermiconidia calcicola TaxID=1690605 RepID=A0ACC3MNQ2_9PEZI|nr:hypothetical protein LTR37_016502 [Vermiconidia calcicola]